MKQLHVIVLLFLLLAKGQFAQLAPPDVRCLSVGLSGNVTISWLKPADPSGLFVEYEIYHSTSASGPFTKIASVPVYNLTSYTHNGATGNTQSQFYFMKTKFDNGSGFLTSANSDTLRSLYLNLQLIGATSSGDPYAAGLNYNMLATPGLSTSANTYTIYRQGNSGPFVPLLTTSAQAYNNDTTDVCSIIYNYQVALEDRSGCISQSNINGHRFVDKTPPRIPVFDTVSVLPSGQVVLGWTPSASADCIGYTIYQMIGGVKTKIDVINGRNNTLYTFTAAVAGTASVTFFIAANDSCSNISPINDGHNSIFLSASYNTCARQTALNWNAYEGLKTGVLRYELFASTGGPFTRIGSTTNTSFTHQTNAGNVQWTYFVRVVNTAQNATASSNRQKILAYEPPVSSFVYIKSASVTKEDNINIRLLVDTVRNCRAIQLERSEDGILYSTIAYIPFTPLQPHYSYLDEKLEVKKKNYFYKATILDSCGNSRGSVATFKTFTLQVKNDADIKFLNHLEWNFPSGFNAGIVGYNIYRVVNEDYQSAPVAFVGSGNLRYTDNVEDNARDGGKIIYVVEAVEGLGNTYGITGETARCNAAEVYVESEVFIPNAFTPFGKNPLWMPVTHFVEKSDYRVQVYSRWGNKVFETTDDKTGWDGKNAEDGIYVYLLQYKNSRGEYIERKGTITLLKNP